MTYTAGQAVWAEKERGDLFYIIKEGLATMKDAVTGAVLAKLGPGGHFGQQSLLGSGEDGAWHVGIKHVGLDPHSPFHSSGDHQLLLIGYELLLPWQQAFTSAGCGYPCMFPPPSSQGSTCLCWWCPAACLPAGLQGPAATAAVGGMAVRWWLRMAPWCAAQ